jgi:predicted nucleic acid-binding Zn ribbon protein
VKAQGAGADGSPNRRSGKGRGRGGGSGREQGPRPLGESMPAVLGRLGAPPSASVMEALFARWEELAGPQLAAHVRPRRVDGAVLVLAADHPAWATRARLGAGRILELVKSSGGSGISRIEVVIERV